MNIELEQLMAQAKQAHMAGDLVAAEHTFQRVLDFDAANDFVMNLLGIVSYQQGKHEQAQAYLRRAIAKNGAVANYFYNLAVVLSALGQRDAALEAAQQSTTLNAEDADYLLNLGICLYNKKRYEDALVPLKKAQALAPDNSKIHLHQATVYRELKNYQFAELKLKQALQLAPDYRDAQLAMEDVRTRMKTAVNLDRDYGQLPPAGAAMVNRRRALAESFANEAGWGNFTDNPASLKTFDFLCSAGDSCDSQDIVLDISAGQCFNRAFFAHAQYLGIDLAIGDIQWDFSGLDLIGDALNLPICSESVDVCLNCVSLEHYPDPVRAFSEFSRVLKAGGRLYLTVPFVYPEHQVPHDYFRFTRYGLAHLCKQSGLEVVSISPDKGYYTNTLDWLISSLRVCPDATLKNEAIAYLNSRVRPAFVAMEQKPGIVVDYPQAPVEEQFPSGYLLVAKKPGNLQPSPRLENRQQLRQHLAACPNCKSGLQFTEQKLVCDACGANFDYLDGIPRLLT